MGRTWLQKLETFLIVTVISVLVWLYADVQTVKQWTNQHIRISLVPLGEQPLAISPSNEQPIRINFRASNQQYQQFVAFNRRLKDEVKSIEVPLDAPPLNSSATRTLNAVYLLQQTDLNDLRLDITSTEPSELTVRVEPLERVQLPVRVLTDGANVTVGPVDSRKITVSVPRSFAPIIEAGSLVADVTQLDLTGAEPGIATERQVPVRLPEEILQQADEFTRQNITYQPDRVSLTITPQSQNETRTIEQVKLFICVPPETHDRFDITVVGAMRFVSDVSVTGPRKAIETLMKDTRSVSADLRPTIEELERVDGGKIQLRPQITGLPPLIYVSSPLPQIEVAVAARPAAAH